jgi:hypothetical protein
MTDAEITAAAQKSDVDYKAVITINGELGEVQQGETAAQDIFNGSGYEGAAVATKVVLSDTEFSGAISATTVKHSTDNGKTQNTTIDMAHYYQIGHVVNKAYFNGSNYTAVTVDANSTWTPTDVSIITELTLESYGSNKASIKDANIYVDGKYTEVKDLQGKTTRGVITIVPASTISTGLGEKADYDKDGNKITSHDATHDSLAKCVAADERFSALAIEKVIDPVSASYGLKAEATALTASAKSTKDADSTLSSIAKVQYQWYVTDDVTDITKGIKIEGATEASYTPSTDTVGTRYYYCVMTNVLTDDSQKVDGKATEYKSVSVTTKAAAIEVKALSAPTITAQPQKVETTVGAAATVSVTATNSDAGTLSYEWYSCDADGSNEKLVGGGAEFTVDTSAEGTKYYYVVVKNTLDNTFTQTKSDVVSVTVAAAQGEQPGQQPGDEQPGQQPGDQPGTDNPSTPGTDATTLTVAATSVSKTWGDAAFNLGATSNAAITYATSDAKVATVDADGNVTLVSTGKATITVTAGDKTETVAITVKPKKAAVKSVKSAKKAQVTVKAKKLAKVKGYQVQVSTSKKFTKATTKSVKSTKVTATIKKLKSGKKYYVRVRGYKAGVNGAWSAIKTVTVK